jgi:hypothetical protein
MKTSKPIRSLSLAALALICATGLSACKQADNQGTGSPGGSSTAPGGSSSTTAPGGGGTSEPGGGSSPSGGGTSPGGGGS